MGLDLCHSKDMFVFPKGLVHFQYNVDAQELATTISAFGTAMSELFQFPSLCSQLELIVKSWPHLSKLIYVGYCQRYLLS